MTKDLDTASSVYYAIADKQVVLLLCGGDKTTQDADIEAAIEYWEDWKKRQENDGEETN